MIVRTRNICATKKKSTNNDGIRENGFRKFPKIEYSSIRRCRLFVSWTFLPLAGLILIQIWLFTEDSHNPRSALNICSVTSWKNSLVTPPASMAGSPWNSIRHRLSISCLDRDMIAWTESLNKCWRRTTILIRPPVSHGAVKSLQIVWNQAVFSSKVCPWMCATGDRGIRHQRSIMMHQFGFTNRLIGRNQFDRARSHPCIVAFQEQQLANKGGFGIIILVLLLLVHSNPLKFQIRHANGPAPTTRSFIIVIRKLNGPNDLLDGQFEFEFLSRNNIVG